MSTQRAIIMAAGQGKRMRSSLPKVLHEICGRTMLWYVVNELRAAGITDITVVIHPILRGRPELAELGAVAFIEQHIPRGTGDAVRTALASMPEMNDAAILVANGDMPLLDAALFRDLLAQTKAGAAMVVGIARMGAQSSFGRVLRNADQSVAAIVEMRDATPAQAALEEMNIGIYGFAEAPLRAAIGGLRAENAQNEYYLTDMLPLLRAHGGQIAALEITDSQRVLGVNDLVELSIARRALNARLCELHMRAGVTIIDPATTYLEPELDIASDTIIAPNTSIGGRSTIGSAARIGPNTRLIAAQIGARSGVRESVVIDSSIAADCEIGPFAHVRMQSIIADDVRIGNFVELKNAHVASGVRAGHLSYLGDAQIGARANIGAGTITCNYDGKNKHRTEIGAGAFIGSNSSLVAPVRIGTSALTGAGSVVTKDVPDEGRVAGNPARALPARVSVTPAGS